MRWTEFMEMEGLEDIRLPSEFIETHESAEVVGGPIFEDVDCNEEAFQRSAPRSGKWRRVRLAISACKRMRLVGESVKAVDAEKAEKIETEINLAFAQASQVPLPDPFSWPTAEESHCQWIGTSMPKFNCTYSLTPAGKLKFEMESVEPLAPMLFSQVASEVSARLDSLTFLGVGPVEGSEDPRPLSTTPGDAPTQPDFITIYDKILNDFLNDDQRWAGPEQVVDSTHSATMPAVDEAMQSGIVDQFSQGSTISVAPWDLLQPGTDLPGSQVVDFSGGWTQSQNTSMKEAYGLTESGQCDQEPHEVSKSDSPQKTMQNDPAWSQISKDVVSKIGAIFNEINLASDRAKLQNTQTEARDCSAKLQKEIRHFEGEFVRMFNELKTTLLRVSKSVPGHLSDQLKRAMSQVTLFNTKELKHLVQEANGVTKKLDKIVHELKIRNLSASNMFQKCTSAVAYFVETILGLTSNFILVEDFNRYRSDLYKLPHFRADAGKVM